MLRRLAFVAVVALAACSSKKSADPGSGSGSSEAPAAGTGASSKPLDAAGILAKLESFRDVACACTDVTCVQNNERDMRNWLLREGPGTMKLKPSAADMAAAEKVTTAMTACVDKIMNPRP